MKYPIIMPIVTNHSGGSMSQNAFLAFYIVLSAITIVWSTIDIILYLRQDKFDRFFLDDVVTTGGGMTFILVHGIALLLLLTSFVLDLIS